MHLLQLKFISRFSQRDHGPAFMSCIHAGQMSGCMYMVADAYSKFPEVVKMTNTTAQTTITALRDIFSRHGPPEILVSDNGAQFTARGFILNNSVQTMAYCIDLQQPINRPPMARLSVLYKF